MIARRLRSLMTTYYPLDGEHGSLQLPRVRIPASTLEGLRPGMMLRLDVPAHSLPLLSVAGKSLFEARAVRQGPHLASRVERRLFRNNDELPVVPQGS